MPYSFSTFQKPTRDSGPPSRALTKSHGDDRLCSKLRPPVAHVAADPVGRLVAERHDPLLVALADAGQVALVEVAGRRA